MPSEVLPKKQTAKSSTMKGATSPCQSVQAKTEPNRDNSFKRDKGKLLYSVP